MNVRYRIELSQAERGELAALLSGGKHAARKLKRAQILLAADAGSGDEEIARAVAVGGSTVYRTKRRFVRETDETFLPRRNMARTQAGPRTHSPTVESEMVQVAGSSAFCGAATAFICMGDPVLGFLSGICALAWAATTSELRSLRLPRGEILRRL